jgi:hypothetical protein
MIVCKTMARLGLLLLCLAGGVAATAQIKPQPRNIRFADQSWQVIHSTGLRGPGPNHFDARNVWLDEQGRLVMETAFRDGRWTSAHVFLRRSLGYGTYELVLAALAKPLDILSVFGFFTWDDDPAYANREIDIELARWGHPTAPNLNYTVQPGEGYPERHLAVEFDLTSAPVTLRFQWRPDSIYFSASSAGRSVEWHFPATGTAPLQPFTVPPKGRERLGLNLWLFQGQPPASADRIIIERFTFTRMTSN